MHTRRFKGVAAENVVRLLLPDVVVFITSLVTLCLCAVVMAMHGKKLNGGKEEVEEVGVGEEEEPRTGHESLDDKEGEATQSPTVPRSPEGRGASGQLCLRPPFSSDVQCYLRLPKVTVYLFEAAIFIFLGLSGELAGASLQ